MTEIIKLSKECNKNEAGVVFINNVAYDISGLYQDVWYFIKNLDLDDKNSNKLFYKKLNNIYYKLVKRINEYTILYKSDKKKEFYVLDLNDKTVEYYLKYKLVDISFMDKPLICQSWVWRSNNLLMNGMAKEIYWDHLFDIAGGIITDGLQTNNGKRFWSYRVQEALNKNINVYYVDLRDEGTLLKIENSRDFSSISNELYGKSSIHEDRKIILTNSIIEQF